jgi:hypothetical protein
MKLTLPPTAIAFDRAVVSAISCAVVHMPRPISQAIYRHERQQAAHERQKPGGKL